MFRVGLFHLKSSMIKIPIVRHGNTLASYVMNKGIYIPMAKSILSLEEHAKYELYRKIKLGDHKWLDAHVSVHPLRKEEQISLTEYISDLKKQPYSIPNFGIGYLISNFSVKIFMFMGQFQILGLSQMISPTFGVFGYVAGSVAVSSVIPTTVMCYYILKHGVKILINEFKSSYYNYDEMIRICNKSNNALKNEQ